VKIGYDVADLALNLARRGLWHSTHKPKFHREDIPYFGSPAEHEETITAAMRLIPP
jgi:hypothetical protein